MNSLPLNPEKVLSEYRLSMPEEDFCFPKKEEVLFKTKDGIFFFGQKGILLKKFNSSVYGEIILLIGKKITYNGDAFLNNIEFKNILKELKESLNTGDESKDQEALKIKVVGKDFTIPKIALA